MQKFADSFDELLEGVAREARAARSGLSTLAPAELVERIWERDPSVWTGRDEAHWLGWLDEPARMRERAHELLEFATRLEAEVDDVVLMGMGGSSLAPEVMRRSFRAERFHVLDTTHPTAIRRLEERIDVGRTLFVAASKSGTTLETRSHADGRASLGEVVGVRPGLRRRPRLRGGNEECPVDVDPFLETPTRGCVWCRGRESWFHAAAPSPQRQARAAVAIRTTSSTSASSRVRELQELVRGGVRRLVEPAEPVGFVAAAARPTDPAPRSARRARRERACSSRYELLALRRDALEELVERVGELLHALLVEHPRPARRRSSTPAAAFQVEELAVPRRRPPRASAAPRREIWKASIVSFGIVFTRLRADQLLDVHHVAVLGVLGGVDAQRQRCVEAPLAASASSREPEKSSL